MRLCANDIHAFETIIKKLMIQYGQIDVEEMNVTIENDLCIRAKGHYKGLKMMMKLVMGLYNENQQIVFEIKEGYIRSAFFNMPPIDFIHAFLKESDWLTIDDQRVKLNTAFFQLPVPFKHLFIEDNEIIINF